MELTGIRRDVFLDRYALKDGEGRPVETTPEQMWDRVARAIAGVEAPDRRAEWERRFRAALHDFRFVPGGRILAGAGTGQQVTFYNCLPPDEQVLTPGGYRPIAALDVRDAVVTGHGRPRYVTHIFTREAEEPVYRLRTAAGRQLSVTGEHPVLARPEGRGTAWVKARDLRPGDLLAALPAPGETASGPWRVERPEPLGVDSGRYAAAAAWGGFGGGATATLVRRRQEQYGLLAWTALLEVEVRPYAGLVYDIAVEEDHSFLTGGVIVSNCYVIPSPQDSRRGIMDSVGLMVEIMSRGGGVGVNLSSLRPRGSYVRGVNGTASGPVSWGEVYSTATGAVIQGGSRRGALMLMLDDDHPDVEEFITVKRDLSRINNANLSVCVSDRFMQAVREDDEWQLAWDGEVRKTVRARDLWSLICESAWASGEPGVVFMERYQKWSNTWYCEDIRCVNPCGEQGLGAWGVCNLGAINLSAFARDGDVDWDGLRETVGTAVRFLDNVIDTTEYYFEENEKQQRYGIRRTGLGSMGLADLLIKLRIRYGTEEAVAFCERLYRIIRDEAYRTSALIAAEKGPFPAFDRERYLQGHFVRQLPADVQELIRQNGTRNGVLLTQAPTGTTSLIAGASSGIEPVYAFSFKRTDRTGTHIVYHELFRRWLEAHEGESVPAYFVTADQLTPEEHVRMQAAIQAHVDSSISKTVNAPNAHTVEEVETLYTLAYELGCKGVTYFRDGCRAGVLTRLDGGQSQSQGAAEGGSAAAGEEEAAQAAAAAGELPLGLKVNGAWGRVRPIKRPARLQGFTDRKETPLGSLFLTLNTLERHPVELFAQIGKAGSDVSAFTEGIARLVSLALRSGVDPQEVAHQLVGIGGSRSVGFGAGRVRSVPDAIGQFIREISAELKRQPAGQPDAPAAPGSGGRGEARPGRRHRTGNGHSDAGSGSGGQASAGPAGASPAGDGAVGGGPGGSGQGGAQDTTQGPGPQAGDLTLEARAQQMLAADPLLDGSSVSFNLCPECGLHTLAYIEGCALCFACGFSEC